MKFRRKLAGTTENLLVGLVADLGFNGAGASVRDEAQQSMMAGRRKWHGVVGVVAAVSCVTMAPGLALAQQAGTKPWSLDDALPANSPAAQSHPVKTGPAAKSNISKSEPAKTELGRLPLRSGAGSFGFETKTMVKTTEFPDGRKVPGVETSPHREPTYLGLSISVPTSGK